MSEAHVSDQPLFDLQDVTFGYPGGPEVLRSVHLRLPQGRKICLLGRNGAGKSTLLYLLGLLWEGQLRGGRITCQLPGEAALGYDQLTPQGRRLLRGKRFGFILQDAYLMPQLTCVENVAMPLLLAGRPPNSARDQARKFIETVGGSELAELQDRQIDTLSGGQRQMMAVLRALIHEPDVVFADEPTRSLDENYRPRVLQLLDRWHGNDSQRRTLLLVLHEPRDVCERGDCDVIFLNHEGRVREQRLFLGSELNEQDIRSWIQHSG